MRKQRKSLWRNSAGIVNVVTFYVLCMKNKISLQFSSCVDCNSIRKVHCLVVVSRVDFSVFIGKSVCVSVWNNNNRKSEVVTDFHVILNACLAEFWFVLCKVASFILYTSASSFHCKDVCNCAQWVLCWHQAIMFLWGSFTMIVLCLWLVVRDSWAKCWWRNCYDHALGLRISIFWWGQNEARMLIPDSATCSTLL